MKLDTNSLAKLLTRNLAERKMSSKDMELLSRSIFDSKHKIRRIDPCIYGICIDYEVPGTIQSINLNDIFASVPGSIRNVDIFPEGIIEPDFVRVRVAQSF